MTGLRDDLDGLWLAVADPERVRRALVDDAAEEGFEPAPLGELAPYGRWLHGEEDPTVRRYAVAPPFGGWIGLFPSQPDWDHDRAPALGERLGCTVASLMLHDGDVFTLHVHEGARLVATHVSSPVHFDLPPRTPGALDLDPAGLLPYCVAGTSEDELRTALTPPGRIDVDGRRAMAATAGLLGLGPAAALTYALVVGADGLHLSAEHAAFDHLAFRFEDDGDVDPGPPPGGPPEDEAPGRLLPFRGGGDDGKT